MKTPRPPGAWGTPASSVPSRLDELFEPEAASTPPVKYGVASEETSSESYISADSGLMTPAASMSRAPGQTTIGQTPAPPGGWLATPGTDKRKSLLKVRFEISEPEVEVDVSSVNGDVTPAGHEHTLGQTTLATPAFPGAMPKTPVPPPKMEVSADEMESVGSTLEHNTFDGHAKPAGPLPPLGRAADIVERQTPRRGGIRVLDAYGREDVKNGVKEEVSEPEVREETRSMMRIVNAMGDIVEEEELKQEEDDMDITANTTLDISTDAPLSREDALRVIRSGVAELASTMDEPMP
jgi:serine/arginine repetitive matrix protein 2